MPAGHVRVPPSVARRTFDDGEVVLLNLQTEQYHALTRLTGRVFELLGETDSLEAVVSRIAREDGRGEEEVASEVVQSCALLGERGLLEIDLAS